MGDLNLKQYEKLGPFEIKDFLAKVASKSAEEASISYLNAGRGNPNWVATEPREAFFLLGQFAVTESKRVLDLPPGVGGMPKAAGRRRPPRGLAEEARRHAGCAFPAGDGAVGGEEVRLRRRRVRARARRLDHRRPLPGAGSHAGAQRAGRPRIPAVGDVRKPAAERQVQALRGRGRHRRDVLHLQVAEEQSHPQSRRHDRARHADLHAVPRDGAPRGLRPQVRRGAGQAGEPVPVPGRGDQEARSTRRSRRSSSSTRATRSPSRFRPTRSRRSATCSRSGRTSSC